MLVRIWKWCAAFLSLWSLHLSGLAYAWDRSCLLEFELFSALIRRLFRSPKVRKSLHFPLPFSSCSANQVIICQCSTPLRRSVLEVNMADLRRHSGGFRQDSWFASIYDDSPDRRIGLVTAFPLTVNQAKYRSNIAHVFVRKRT